MYLEMINTRQDNKSVNVKDLSYCLKITNIMMDTKNKSFIALCKYMHLPALNYFSKRLRLLGQFFVGTLQFGKISLQTWLLDSIRQNSAKPFLLGTLELRPLETELLKIIF